MKKVIIAALLCAIFGTSKAQYATGFVSGPTLSYIYVGSLSLPESNLGNAQKLQVDVFGGGWNSTDIGVTTYYIANRSGLNIHQVRLGGPSNDNYTLQAFDNGTDNLDFYLVSSSWTAIAVKSCILAGTPQVSQTITNTVTGSVSGTPHAITILPVLVTDDSGNMAVKTNTIDPDYALTVNGDIRAKRVRIETGWADYVLDKRYPLMPLKQVESYIGRNGHLPEVPSAAEVAKNGVSVGDAESMLLRKVEELTLYLIEQQKVNRSLQRQINTLKNKHKK